MKIGVLDIQGSVKEHVTALENIKVEPVLVKNIEDLDEISALIMPGGESTTISKLLEMIGLYAEIAKRAKEGFPVWGTCAGAILMAQMKLLDIEIERNAYGRQQESFKTRASFNKYKIPMIFIRAPKITKVGDKCKVLAEYENDPVAVQCENLLVTTFHPELTDDLSVHQYFADLCAGK